MLSKKTLKLWVPTLFWCLVIFVLSSLPGADFSANKGDNFLIRKSLHVIEYGVLTVCLFRATKKVGLAVLLSILYAVSDEVHQDFIIGRTGKVSDVLFDGFASMLAGLILWKYFQNLPQKLKSWLHE